MPRNALRSQRLRDIKRLVELPERLARKDARHVALEVSRRCQIRVGLVDADAADCDHETGETSALSSFSYRKRSVKGVPL